MVTMSLQDNWAPGHAQSGQGAANYSEAVKFDLRYPGQVWDEETGLAYNLNRYYDREGGRYIQADPIGLEGGWNRFLYVDADPLSYVDPDGLVRRIRDPLDLMPLEGNGGAGLSSGGSGGARPANFSPPGSGRSGAFNEAKRLNGIPTSQQPLAVRPNLNKKGNPQPGREYDFEIPSSDGKMKIINIRDDAGGHNFGIGNPQNRGARFNDMCGRHFDY